MVSGDRQRHQCTVIDASGTRALALADLDRIDELRQRPDTVVWLDVADPDERDLELLGREFGLHPLALEDLQRRRQRPKLDTYPDQHAVVAYEAMARRADGRPQLNEFHLFAGRGWLATVHWGHSPAIADVRDRIGRRSESLGRSTAALLYALLDAAVDTYFPLLDELSERIDHLEGRVVDGDAGPDALGQMLRIKREQLELRRILGPMRDLANALLRRDLALIGDEMVPYFQDLYDHLVRVLDQLDVYRDLLASVLDARLSVQSNALNTVMKRLTAFTVVLMVPTLIAGIYGMNFDRMPELGWSWGYPFALGLMALAVLTAIAFFRAHDWF